MTDGWDEKTQRVWARFHQREALHRLISHHWYNSAQPDLPTQTAHSAPWTVPYRQLVPGDMNSFDRFIEHFATAVRVEGVVPKTPGAGVILVEASTWWQDLRRALVSSRAFCASAFTEVASGYLAGVRDIESHRDWAQTYALPDLKDQVAEIYIDFRVEIDNNREITQAEFARDLEDENFGVRAEIFDHSVEPPGRREERLEAALGHVAAMAARVETAKQSLDYSVGVARASGSSWEAIGTAVGISQQAAHQRWAKREKELIESSRDEGS